MTWRDWIRRRDRRAEIDEEIASHLRMAAEDRVDRGEPPDEAQWAAQREFGNARLIREDTRAIWSWTAVEQLLQDLRFGARILWHAPGLSAAAVILIALVIGGNTTIYSIVHGVLTAPAPGVTADDVVCIGQVSPWNTRFGPFTSYPNYLDYAAQAKTVRRLSAWIDERLTIGVDDGTYAVFGAPVTTGFFDTFGVRIAVGRGFHDRDNREDLGLVAVISDRLWRERFQQAADVVGRAIVVNGQATTIIGVTAPGFHGANLTPGADIWLPMEAFHKAIGTDAGLYDRSQMSVLIAGQLAPGTDLSQAQAELATLSTQLASAYPDDNKDRRATVFNYSATAFLPTAELAPRFLAIFSIVTVLTLLIVSANVANLMLARAASRQRETAVRQSLGASRGRIVRMLMAEGVVVSVAAWAAACVFAWWVSWGLVRLLPPARQGLLPDLRPDWQVAAYAMGLAVLATVAFTIAPALRTWRQHVLPWLKAGEQSIAAGRSTLSSALVVVQLAFSVLLLTTAGLGYRSLSLLDSGDVGFAQENLLLITVRTVRAGHLMSGSVSAADREATLALLERIRARLLGVHDVQSVTYSRRVPGAYLLSGVPVWRPGRSEPMLAMRRPVGPNYLDALGLAPLAGRDLNETDRDGAARTAVINQHLTAALFPGESPLGQTLQVDNAREPVEVVGVAPNALFDGPSRDPQPTFVFLAEQQSIQSTSFEPTFFVRYRGRLESVAPAASKAVAEVDAAVPIVAMRTMASQLETVTELERMVATLLMCFAAASLAVAALGQYAIVTFNMRRRIRDFGVRMALGASARQIQGGVVHEALQLTAIGLLLGFALSGVAGLAFKRVLFGITPTDPTTYAGVFTLLVIASVLASYLPAWRAGRVNVIEALRQE